MCTFCAQYGVCFLRETDSSVRTATLETSSISNATLHDCLTQTQSLQTERELERKRHSKRFTCKYLQGFICFILLRVSYKLQKNSDNINERLFVWKKIVNIVYQRCRYISGESQEAVDVESAFLHTERVSITTPLYVIYPGICRNFSVKVFPTFYHALNKRASLRRFNNTSDSNQIAKSFLGCCNNLLALQHKLLNCKGSLVRNRISKKLCTYCIFN